MGLSKKIAQLSKNPFKTIQIHLSFALPLTSLCHFYQVSVTILQTFERSLQKHIKRKSQRIEIEICCFIGP